MSFLIFIFLIFILFKKIFSSKFKFFNKESEKMKSKFKRLIPSPNSFFMDVKCPKCFEITIIFSHSQTLIKCEKCSTILGEPTGGKVFLNKRSVYHIKK
ncbi:40S ribosomal protein S27 (nucleomorph) [Chroomonas mesostigmatica CCMP1168]|uniref:40S ribosomal protein S27 n=1 Tax=Chroomonas mesostigmatica CCMP1168 TaxID=1195612 RepID=J7G2L6_9CRYP|nr:40S ribosomal protein S27 [Chroomonas mesostigmatica CCMP1168]|mmetsp:Transcript_26012/g.64225  ORF Transcript_26012/g.64225 Transcript_26012/m.64225 type:complete len:99 (+) Transcript_26012:71-367(+)